MNILDKIIANKKIEVEERKLIVSENLLMQTKDFNRTCFSLIENLKNKPFLSKIKKC